ncbi:MAG: leucine--tRNA ligase [Clostridia bacterium]|nr:leucine--tRNA ligase [Clostridia bacterium]
MYQHLSLEKKWQKYWQDINLYHVIEDDKKPKQYILDMFPYPSGEGLHVGHPKGYIATDIISRMKMMQGYNVLHPMGWDAFGLPAENYALKNKVHPKIAVEKNIIRYRQQLDLLGFSYDWSRELDTTDPKYYKWTQWIFLQMWKKGLAYESFAPINWCPSCCTGLANEDLENGLCERCGSVIEQRPLRQWVLKITDYADRLLADLDDLTEWEESIKDMQRNWIGRSEGAEIDFHLNNLEDKITVFTTRLDTIYGCSYLVLAPEHQLVLKLKDQIQNWPELSQYLDLAKHKSDLERGELNKEKTGIILDGVVALNPFNQEKIPVYVADYVLKSYGTGAVMAVPAHDERDWQFAKKYQLEVKQVINENVACSTEIESVYTDDGVLINSAHFSGLSSFEAREKMMLCLEEKKLGRRKVNYKLKDWVYSRQRYWGEPIPLVHCKKCGVVAVPEKDLPVILPPVESYQPSGTGESPLATISDWVNTTCPQCGGPAKRETNTMPQWGGSCWYYLRYMDPQNDQELVARDREKYWSPVDLYVGGAEHATRHLIYARFWHKFLYDIGIVSQLEPFKKLRHVGLVMGQDGRKMSKRWGNVINPDDMIELYGADALRIYVMFMGPFDQAAAWNVKSLIGSRKFLDKLNSLFLSNKSAVREDRFSLSLLHKTIKKVTEDIEDFHFNTAVSAMMILVNQLNDYFKVHQVLAISLEQAKKLAQILAPFAPHLAEDIWHRLGEENSIFQSSWPDYNPELIKAETINYVIQVNGKLRAQLVLDADVLESEIITKAKEIAIKWLAGQEIKKTIFVPDKLINFVV